MHLSPGEWVSQGARVQTPWEDICGLAEVGPLGPCCHRQRAPAVAQVRARGGGSFPGFQRNRVGSQVWKLPPRGSREAPSPGLSAQVSLTFHPRSCSARRESDFLGVGVRKPGVSAC